MRVTRLELTNVSCFAEIVIDFRQGLNLICGPNGVGKTTILDAIAEPFIGPFGGRLKRRADSEKGKWRIDVDIEGNNSSTQQQVNAFLPEEGESQQGFFHYSKYLIYVKTRRDFEYKRLAAVPADRKTDDSTTSQLAKSGLDNKDLKGWLVQRWLYNYVPNGLPEHAKANLETATSAFSALDKTVSFSHAEHNSFEIITKTKSGDIPFEYLSSGFKSSLYIILGIIKEIEFRNLSIAVRDFDGVILIDEPDLHLHPSWQQNFIPAIKQTFPKAQIIATTHSPHMVQSASPDEVIALSQDAEGDYAVHTFEGLPYGFSGWSVEEILTDVMGLESTRTAIFRDSIRNFEKALETHDVSATSETLGVLEQMLHPQSELRKIFRIQASAILAENDQT